MTSEFPQVEGTTRQELLLHGQGRTEFPTGVLALPQLRILYLNENLIAEVPEEIGALQALVTLNLDHNRLAVLPASLGALSQLRVLSAGGNKLTVFPTQVRGLEHLTTLLLFENEIDELPNMIGELNGLQSLSLRSNKLEILPPRIAELGDLVQLSLADNALTHLPPEIGQLSALKTLTLGNNRLSSLPSSIGALTSLVTLSAGANDLTQLPAEIGGLEQLRSLKLEDNEISELPAEVGNLSNLRELDVSNNRLRGVPWEIGNLPLLKEIHLTGNPLDPGALGILERRGSDGLLDFIKVAAAGFERVGEAKILIVGDGGVGKSWLVGRLTGRSVDELEGTPSTHGVEIADFSEEIDGQSYVLRYWDFGGQEEYRITHQYFFSPDTTYLVAWNARLGPEQGDLAGWLERIRLRVPEGANIILVATHSEDQNPAVDIDFLQEVAGGNIRGFVAVDSQTGLGLDQLRQMIASSVIEMGVADRSCPSSYLQLAAELEKVSEPQISWGEFVEMGVAVGIEAINAESAAIQLAAVGRLTYFKNPALQGRVVLQPDWLTASLSYVLKDRDTRERGGSITESRLKRLWTTPPYQDAPVTFAVEDVPFLTQVLLLYGVAFRLKAPNADTLLVSQLVPYQRPDGVQLPASSESNVLRLSVDLGAPISRPELLPGLTSRLHDYTTGIWWRRGLYVEDDDAFAVLEMMDESTLQLTTWGAGAQRFFSFLRGSIESRLRAFPGLTPSHHLFCPGRIEDGLCGNSWDVKDLSVYAQAGESTVFCTGCRTRVDIGTVLAQVSAPTVHEQTSIILDAISRSTEATIESVSDVYSLSRALLDVISPEIRDTPRLATIAPVDNDDWRRLVTPDHWAKVTWTVQLWCEHPGHEHPCGRVFQFKRSRDWFVRAQPYLKWANRIIRVTPIARHALGLWEEVNPEEPESKSQLPLDPTGGGAVGDERLREIATGGGAVGDERLREIASSIRLGESLLTAIASDANGDQPTGHAGESTSEAVPPEEVELLERFEPASVSLRALRSLLHDVNAMENGRMVVDEPMLTAPDPTILIGRGASGVSADGLPRWICRRHWDLYPNSG